MQKAQIAKSLVNVRLSCFYIIFLALHLNGKTYFLRVLHNGDLKVNTCCGLVDLWVD